MNKRKTLTILGAGGTGHAMAAYFSLCGLDVCLCDSAEYGDRFAAIEKQGGIELRGNSGKSGLVMPALVTTDFQKAMEHADRVFICAPADRHEEFARYCAPYVRKEHCFCISNGNLGSPIFKKVFREAGAPEAVVGELAGNLGSCRLLDGAAAVIALPVGEKKVSAYPASQTQELIDAFAGVIPMTPASHIFEAALNSPNVVIHLAGSLLSATAVEKAGNAFRLFTDGMSDAAQACIAAVEGERNAVMNKLGFTIYESITDFIKEIRDPKNYPELDVFRTLDGPSSMRHRYIREDALAGVSLLLSLGEEYGVSLPVQRAFLTLASAINSEDYYGKGRTLKNLGLDGLTADELVGKLLGA